MWLKNNQVSDVDLQQQFESVEVSNRDFFKGLDQGENNFSITTFVLLIYLFEKKKNQSMTSMPRRKKLINCLMKKEEPCGTWKLNTTTKVFVSGTVIDYCCL